MQVVIGFILGALIIGSFVEDYYLKDQLLQFSQDCERSTKYPNFSWNSASFAKGELHYHLKCEKK
jgi:hypothetical protein